MQEGTRAVGLATESMEETTPFRSPAAPHILGGRYRCRCLIGRGGMADVYLGDDLILARAVAIKLLHPNLVDDTSRLERFRREAIALATVQSRHVVGIYDIRHEGNDVYLVMQHVEGKTLQQDVVRNGAMSPIRAERVLRQVLDGLGEVHARGLIHRDIKPSNIVVEANDHVVLLDLGVVLDKRREHLTLPGTVMGTPAYLAPENRAQSADALTSDVYQLGLLMLFLMTAVDPVRECATPSIEELIQELPVTFQCVARRALAADPAERFPAAGTMKVAVELALRLCADGEACRGSDFRRTHPGEYSIVTDAQVLDESSDCTERTSAIDDEDETQPPGFRAVARMAAPCSQPRLHLHSEPNREAHRG